MTIKTAMILAAGRGERMRPLTDSLPKPLLTIHHKPLLVYHLHALKQAGYQRVVINHAWLGQKIVDEIGDGNQFGLQVVYSAESHALETAGGIIKALPLLCQTGDDTFTVVNGDVFTDFDFSTLPIELPQKHAHLVMVDNPVHNPAGDFCFKDKRLLEAGADKLTFSGVACYHSSFFAGQKADVKPLAPMLRTAIKDKLISAQHYKGQWTDVGTPERLAELNMTSTNQE